MDISAVYRMELIERLDKTIWSKYSSYKKVEQYVKLNQTLYDNFGNANSVLESIIKEILSDSRFAHISVSNANSKKLVQEILKVFQLNPDSPELPNQMKSISSSFVTVAKAIEDLRSDNTLFHGQDSEKYLISEPLYAYFVVNACATVGLFLIDFYEKKFPKVQMLNEDIFDEELPF